MKTPRRWIRPPTSWARALLLGAVAGLAYTGITTAYSLIPSTSADISEPVWRSAVLLWLFSLGSIGVPVVLWLRYRFRGPLALVGFVLLFWHVLVEFPPVGSGQGDSPGFLFVFAFAPAYVVGYVVLAVLEYWFRNRDLPNVPRQT